MGGPPENFAWLLRSRRGYLGTLGADGTPHVFPVCFTWAGDLIWMTVDGEPKAGPSLQAMADIQSNPRVSFTVDRWDEDWARLAWLQSRGMAKVIPPGFESDKALKALLSKYNQYSELSSAGPVIRIEVERWVSWEPGA